MLKSFDAKDWRESHKEYLAEYRRTHKDQIYQRRIKNSHKPIVYSITNLANGRKYIGSSTLGRERWNKHVYDLRNNIHGNRLLQDDWNQYGEKCFKFEVLETWETDAQIRDREQELINLYQEVYNLNNNKNRGGLS